MRDSVKFDARVLDGLRDACLRLETDSSDDRRARVEVANVCVVQFELALLMESAANEGGEVEDEIDNLNCRGKVGGVRLDGRIDGEPNHWLL